MTPRTEKDIEEELEFDKSPNPKPFRPDPPEHPAARKARLFQWHYAKGTMGMYYDMYPEDRPPEREPVPAPQPRGRSR
jgi:hypothetical protein